MIGKLTPEQMAKAKAFIPAYKRTPDITRFIAMVGACQIIRGLADGTLPPPPKGCDKLDILALLMAEAEDIVKKTATDMKEDATKSAAADTDAEGNASPEAALAAFKAALDAIHKAAKPEGGI